MPRDPEEVSVAVFAALADPNRRAILASLTAHGPSTATDLSGRLLITRQGITKHLTLLADAGLVSSDAGGGRRVLFRHRSEPMKVAQTYLAALAADWDSSLDRLATYLASPHAPLGSRRDRLLEETDMPDTEREAEQGLSFAATIVVDQTPDVVFAAINDVRAWWLGEIEGPTAALGDEFTYRHGDVHFSKQRIVESTPGERVAWLVVDAHLSFTADPGEWTGTTVTFDIVRTNDRTEIRFTHVGLVPDVECYTACSNAWASYVNGNLRTLLSTPPA